MKKLCPTIVYTMALSLLLAVPAWADTAEKEKPKETKQSAEADMSSDQAAGAAETPSTANGAAKKKPKPEYRPFADVLGDAEAVDGLIKLYRKDGQLYGELTGRI